VIVERAIADGLVNLDRDTRNFIDYVIAFWDFDTSEYIRRRNQKSPNSIGKDYAMGMLNNFKNHARRFLPPRLNVHEVTSLHIEKVIDSLLDEGHLVNATIMKVVQSMSVPLKEAARKKLIAHNPMDGVEPLANAYKERGIYTMDEIRKVLDRLYQKGTEGVDEMRGVRGKNHAKAEKSKVVKTDLKPYLAVALAAYTGMRAGEIRALCSEQIKPVNDAYGIITVDRAFNDYAKQKSTKGKRTRKVPVPRKLCDQLLEEAARNPHEGSTWVFWSKSSRDNPIASTCILKQFYKALVATGISESARIERNIDFHSLRHTFNTNLRGRIDEKALRAIIGHESVEMTNRYTHETEEDILAAGTIIGELFKKDRQGQKQAGTGEGQHETGIGG